MSDTSKSVEILVKLKKIVDSYEEILELTKRIVNETRAYGYSKNLAVLKRKLKKLHKEVIGINEEVQKYGITKDLDLHVSTLLQYLALVSLPYEEDLLLEVKNYVKDESVIKDVEEYIHLTRNAREQLLSII